MRRLMFIIASLLLLSCTPQEKKALDASTPPPAIETSATGTTSDATQESPSNNPSNVQPANATSTINAETFGPNGEGGFLNHQTFAFGQSGLVYELDAYLNIAGENLGGSFPGPSRRLSAGGAPPGIGLEVNQNLSDDKSDITLTYRFTTAKDKPSFRFFVFLDAQIGSSLTEAPDSEESIKLMSDEYGVTVGRIGGGSGDPDPDSWEIDEPGYVFGNVIPHLEEGTLDKKNAVPKGSMEDVSMALGFDIGALRGGDTATIEILLSSDADSIGSFALQHLDAVNADSLTLSGQATVTNGQ